MPASPWHRVVSVSRQAIRLWALLGGLILVGLVLMTAASAISNILVNQPFAPDYELVKHFVAIAIFCFLPYCQLTGANVTVDIFTESMGAVAKGAMAALSSLFAVAFAGLLVVQMYDGLLGYLQYPEVTPVLKLPLWTAFPPILLSLLLLLIAGVITTCESIGRLRGREPVR